MELATNVYELTSGFPKEEKYGITAQLRRSSVSVPSNIAEGAGRNGNKEFANFLGIATGSLFEIETQLLLSIKFGFIKNDVSPILVEIGNIVNMIFKLKERLN